MAGREGFGLAGKVLPWLFPCLHRGRMGMLLPNLLRFPRSLFPSVACAVGDSGELVLPSIAQGITYRRGSGRDCDFEHLHLWEPSPAHPKKEILRSQASEVSAQPQKAS